MELYFICWKDNVIIRSSTSSFLKFSLQTYDINWHEKLKRVTSYKRQGWQENVVNNFIKNGIAVLISFNDNLRRAMTQLLIDEAWKYRRYPLMEAKIFILFCNVEINKYRPQQIDIGILFPLSIWMHLVISSCLLYVEPLWTNEWHLHLKLNLFVYEWNVSKLSNSLYNSTFQH